jgi:hypothetical protein
MGQITIVWLHFGRLATIQKWLDADQAESNNRMNGRATSFGWRKRGANEDKVPWLAVAWIARRSTASLDDKWISPLNVG